MRDGETIFSLGAGKEKQMAPTTVLAPLESRVRHLVRESGIDPQRHMSALDQIIEQALDEYEERSILGE